MCNLQAIVPRLSCIRNVWSQLRDKRPVINPSFISWSFVVAVSGLFTSLLLTVRLWLSGRYCQTFQFEQILIAHFFKFYHKSHWQCSFDARFSPLFLPFRLVFHPVPPWKQHVSFGDLEVLRCGKPEAASLCRVNLMQRKQHAIVIIWPYLRHWWIPLTQM